MSTVLSDDYITELPVTTTEWLEVHGFKTFRDDDVEVPTDPKELQCQVAILNHTNAPASGDWANVDWDSSNDEPVAIFTVGGLASGMDFELSADEYNVWTRCLGALVKPERIVGKLRMTS